MIDWCEHQQLTGPLDDDFDRRNERHEGFGGGDEDGKILD